MTPAAFFLELAEFRKAMTSPQFAALTTDQKHGMIDGITQAYLQTAPNAMCDQARLFTLWFGHLREFEQRAGWSL